MTLEALISISGMITAGAVTYAVMNSYRKVRKSAEPDMARVQRFVDSAPMERLTNVKAG